MSCLHLGSMLIKVIAKQFENLACSCYPNGIFKLKMWNCMVILQPRYRRALQERGPIHPLTRKLLRSYLLVKKLEMAVVAVAAVQPPLIRTVAADFCVPLVSGEKSLMHGIQTWDPESASTSACKLCSMVISFCFQLVFKATS
nr:uncharacterized protein LOC117852576 isoform X1 [Setaria viridis]